jgi:hypothetical protein
MQIVPTCTQVAIATQHPGSPRVAIKLERVGISTSAMNSVKATAQPNLLVADWTGSTSSAENGLSRPTVAGLLRLLPGHALAGDI